MYSPKLMRSLDSPERGFYGVCLTPDEDSVLFVPTGEGSLLFLMKLNSQSKRGIFVVFASPSEILLNNLHSREVVQFQCNQIPRTIFVAIL